MVTYIVTFDINSDERRARLTETLEGMPGAVHFQFSGWTVDSHLGTAGLYERLADILAEGDRLFVCQPFEYLPNPLWPMA